MCLVSPTGAFNESDHPIKGGSIEEVLDDLNEVESKAAGA